MEETVTASADATPVALDRPRRLSAWVLAAGALVVMVPAIVAAVAITQPRWFPTGDMAQAELHVRGFLADPPLVGAAGRIQDANGVQGSHPGPLLWVAMWPLYAIGGSTSTALVASVVTVHVVTMVLVLWLAHRHGGVALALATAVVLALVVRAGGPDVFTEPWNPWMGLLPFAVVLLACWAFLDGDAWAIVLAVAAGTYSVQAHTGYVVVVVGLLVFTVLAGRAWRRPARWWTGAAVVVAAVLWTPPLLDQLRRKPGNLSILRDNFGDPDAPYLGLGDVVEIAVVQFNLLGPWLVGPGRDDVDALGLAGAAGFLALWAAAVVVARPRGATVELRLHAVLGVAAALAVVSVSRIFGVFLEYTVRWVWLIAALAVAVSMVSLWRAVPRSAHARRPAGLVGAGVVAVVALVGAVQFADRAGPTGAIDSLTVGGLVDDVRDRLDPGTPHLVRWWDPTVLGATGFGMVLELERRGVDVGVDLPFAAAALPHRVLPEAQAGAVLYVVTGAPAIEVARSRPGAEELAWFDVRTPDERRRSDELRRELEAALRSAGSADLIPVLDQPYGQARLIFGDPPPPPEVAELLDEYVALRQPVAVFRAAPSTPVLPLA